MRWGSLFTLALSIASASAKVTGETLCNDVGSRAGCRRANLQKPIPLSTFGWIAMGFGYQMPNSSLVIMWPNHDGTHTISQRKAPDRIMPTVVPNPPRIATLDQANSFSNSSSTSYTFSVPTQDATVNETGIIWAMSATKPGSADPAAILVQHSWMGVNTVNMLAEYAPGQVVAGPIALMSRPTLALIAHVTCGALVTMMVLPGGVVLPRITRGLTTSRWWFHYHAVNQGFFALALVCTAFALALSFGGQIDSKHRKTGCALFGLVILQTVLGIMAHFYKPGHTMRKYTFQTKRGRGPSNYLHVVMGIIVVAVGWGACWTGLTSEWTLRGHGDVPHGLRIGWGIVIGIWMSLYIFGIIVFLPRQLVIESQQRVMDTREESKTRDFEILNEGAFGMEPRGGQPYGAHHSFHPPRSSTASPVHHPHLSPQNPFPVHSHFTRSPTPNHSSLGRPGSTFDTSRTSSDRGDGINPFADSSSLRNGSGGAFSRYI